MRIISYIVVLLIILLGISFASLNSDPVTLNYYFNTQKLPLSMLLVLTLTAGALMGLFVGMLIYFRLKRENRRMRNRIRLIEKEVDNLRSIPVKDSH